MSELDITLLFLLLGCAVGHVLYRLRKEPQRGYWIETNGDGGTRIVE